MARVTRDHTVLPATHTFIQMEWTTAAALRSPQPQSITALWLVLISRPAEGRRLSWPGWFGEILRWSVRRRRSPIPVRARRRVTSLIRPSPNDVTAIRHAATKHGEKCITDKIIRDVKKLQITTVICIVPLLVDRRHITQFNAHTQYDAVNGNVLSLRLNSTVDRHSFN